MTVEGLANLRDLGGLGTTEGRVTRGGVLLRSEAPVGLAEDALEAFAALGLHTVLDLREDTECQAKPSTLPDGVARVCIPILAPRDEHGRSMGDLLAAGELEAFGHGDVAPTMTRMLDQQPQTFARAIGALAQEGALPALVHCSAGRDRTGVVVGLILGAIGVDREAIARDYGLSNRLRDATYAAMAPSLQQGGLDPARLEGLFSAPPTAVTDALDHVEREHGSVRAYLESGGLASAAIDRLSAALLEPAGS